MARSGFSQQSPELTKESFERLLDWLDRDRDRAGRRYEEIRNQLIKIFVCRGTTMPEDLADETIDRVARKVPEIAGSYVGEPALYFCGVAQLVHLEYLRKKPKTLPPNVASDSIETADLRVECFDQCMER